MRLMFTIPGKPVTWKRRDKNPKTGAWFDPSKAVKKGIWARGLRAARRSGFKCIQSGPVQVLLVCYFQRPKRDHEGESWYCARNRDDADNLSKLVLDSLNGVAWSDDGQVAELTVLKVYCDDNPRTVVQVSALDQSAVPAHLDLIYTR